MTDARALAERLRDLAGELLRRRDLTTNEADEMRAAADLLDRLAASEGVGLTRYFCFASVDDDGNPYESERADHEGPWVRHDDAAAALAAKDAEIAEQVDRSQYLARELSKKQAQVATLKEALVGQPSPAMVEAAEIALAEVLAGHRYGMPQDGMQRVLAAALSTLPAPAVSEGGG